VLLVVGEIYVRRDSFSVHELSEHLISQGIFPKLSAVSHWLHYTDWARAEELDAARQQDGYSGVAIIAPFGCLPGRVIEGVYTPWARARG
jgi:predicted nucleotide-binding protein (sugar kinase/HSP70/actin superfamily)